MKGSTTAIGAEEASFGLIASAGTWATGKSNEFTHSPETGMSIEGAVTATPPDAAGEVLSVSCDYLPTREVEDSCSGNRFVAVLGRAGRMKRKGFGDQCAIFQHLPHDFPMSCQGGIDLLDTAYKKLNRSREATSYSDF